ncbi:hypothetical protein [Sphingomonas nostoxanthinifaciens]|uniref:hypothetical protein n=1 Tax=Sphingomonas nostoxanthinifaciens TaxID=2872652 RepID=UPI001CC1CBDB|nr:hypothetical protein [Sphingomonas nostoxanthinifaciens]UAK26173.1 hypothetical protein K8P63_08775 [Sphingomonas nostoxanthinifaciens]
MARRYRVIHERLSLLKAIAQGRPTRDCYVAQSGHWWGWRTIERFNTVDDAEQACRDHAGGTLLPGGGRVVAEFERPD